MSSAFSGGLYGGGAYGIGMLGPGSLYPTLALEWAPASGPTVESPTWVDITARLRGCEWTYGRNDELARFDAGNGYVLLDNRDRAFDPTYTAGAWYGQIKTRRQFRLTAAYASTSYPVFRALARSVPQEWPAGGADNIVRIDLADAYSLLQQIDLVSGFNRPDELSGARINAVLDAIGVTSGMRAIDAGTVEVAAINVTESGTSALDHARLVAESEFGQYFIAKDGKHTFLDRNRRLNKPSLHTFTDAAAGTLRYRSDGVTTAYDESYLWNTIRVEDADGTASTLAGEATNAASVTDYGPPITKTVQTHLSRPEDRQALAEYYALLYAQPSLRLTALPLNGAMDPADLWPVILGAEISDRITVERFADSGHTMSLAQNTEGITHAIDPGGWTSGLASSPADTDQYWTLDDAVLAELDNPAILIGP